MLNHKGTKMLRSNKITLRKFGFEDYESVFNNWTRDKDVFKFMTWGPHRELEETRTMVNYWAFMSNNDNYYNWCITLNDNTNDSIGGIGVSSINEEKRSGEIGYCLAQDHWNEGIATESLRMCLDYLFNEVNFSQINGICDIRNTASLEVMKKCGMKLTEFLPGYKTLSDGTLSDVQKLVIFREDIRN